MNTKKQVKELLASQGPTIRNYGVSRLGLFGSTVRGEDRENSDIDLIVEFRSGQKNYDNFIDLCYFLEDCFGRKVDLVTPEGISPLIKKNIEKEIEYVQVPN